MPHCILELSSTLSEQLDCQAVLEDLHVVLEKSGEFNSQDIKVRLQVSDLALVGGEENDFCHVTMLLLSGRTPGQKKAIAESLFKACEAWLQDDDVSLTVDIRDMDRDLYQKKGANL